MKEKTEISGLQQRAAFIIGHPDGNTEWDYALRIAMLEQLLAEATGKQWSPSRGIIDD